MSMGWNLAGQYLLKLQKSQSLITGLQLMAHSPEIVNKLRHSMSENIQHIHVARHIHHC